MFSRFFIERPVFSWVIAIVIMLAGALAILRLPISQFPQIAPPQVSISATYPGASAETIENTVTQIIEQNLTGLDGYLYMSSTSDSTGRVSITVTFEAGTNPDMAQVQVQNKIQTALTTLPQVVQQMGVTIQKTSANFLMVVGFISKDHSMNASDLGDYLVAHVQEPLSRVQGVGEAEVFGSEYAMRIWLDPSKMVKYKLNPSEVKAAISAQNAQVSAGGIAQQPPSFQHGAQTLEFLQPAGEEHLIFAVSPRVDGAGRHADRVGLDHQAVSVEHRVLAVEFQQFLAVEFGQGHHGNTAPGAQAPVQTVGGSDYQRLGQAAAVATVSRHMRPVPLSF